MRRYNESAIVPARPLKTVVKSIPLDAKLCNVRQASEILNEQFGGGFSEVNLRRLVRLQKFVEGVHYNKVGRSPRFYIPAVIEYVNSGGLSST